MSRLREAAAAELAQFEREWKAREERDRKAREEAERIAAEQKARVEAELGREGRVLVRWSGTEPKLRIMLEGPDEAKIRGFAKELADEARKDVASA